MSAFDAYRMHNAIKTHFNSHQYDYFKYSGKIKSKFLPQSQFYVFELLNKMYKEELESFYISNFVHNPKVWIFDLLSEECSEVYKIYKKKQNNLTYLFKTDIIALLEQFPDFKSVFSINKGYPELMKQTLQEKINIETTILLNNLLKYFDKWDKILKDDLIWADLKFKCIKYAPFIKYDSAKIRKTALEEIKKFNVQ